VLSRFRILGLKRDVRKPIVVSQPEAVSVVLAPPDALSCTVNLLLHLQRQLGNPLLRERGKRVVVDATVQHNGQIPRVHLGVVWWRLHRFAERKAEAQPLTSGGAEADDVLLSVTVIITGAAAVASSVWFANFMVSE
jgi:hypothetical protein